jgi:hypothetical protein
VTLSDDTHIIDNVLLFVGLQAVRMFLLLSERFGWLGFNENRALAA